MQETRPLDDEDLARLLAPRFERVGSKAHVPETIAHVESARREAFERLLGLPVPRVFYHADIRSKHVRVERDGSVLGYLDFGCSSLDDLPYFDLVNLVVHENKREGEFPSTNAWRRLLDRTELAPREISALESYASALSLPEEYCRVIEEIYPILVVAMCELNWDCSRPRWLHEHFGY
jgi:aminoglycoside phosphotransferase (APT) family kinase protein